MDDKVLKWEELISERDNAFMHPVRLFPQLGVYGTPKLFNNIDAMDVHVVIHEQRYKEIGRSKFY